jgi:hypothetical protein
VRKPQLRETFIALRATRTAHRVASDVAYPEMKGMERPPTLSDDVPVLEHDWGDPQVMQNEYAQREVLIFLLVVGIMAGFFILGVWWH